MTCGVSLVIDVERTYCLTGCEVKSGWGSAPVSNQQGYGDKLTLSDQDVILAYRLHNNPEQPLLHYFDNTGAN